MFKQSLVRSVQFVRDAARLVLKTPPRLIATLFEQIEVERQVERSRINAALTGYTLVQMISVPAKVLAALSALAVSPFSAKKARWIQDISANWTKSIDGQRSKLEALKEEGLKHATRMEEYAAYKQWVKKINPHHSLK